MAESSAAPSGVYRRFTISLLAGKELSSDEEVKKVRRHTRTGRPLGSEGFVEELEWKLSRALQRKKPGPKPGGKIA